MNKLIFIIFVCLLLVSCEKTENTGPNTGVITNSEVLSNINSDVYVPYASGTTYQLQGNVNYVEGSIRIDSTSNQDSVYFYVDFSVEIDFQSEYQTYLNQLGPGNMNTLDTPTHVVFNSIACPFMLGASNSHHNVMPYCTNPVIKLSFSTNAAGMMHGESNSTMIVTKYLKSTYDNMGEWNKWWKNDLNVRHHIQSKMYNKTWVMGIIDANKGRWYRGARWHYTV